MATEAMLSDAWRGDIGPANVQVNTGSFTKKPEPSGEVPEVKAAREQYEVDIANAWRQSAPELPEPNPVSYGGSGGKRREE
jgi:hypothetical protein